MEPKTTKKPSRKLVVFKRELPFYLMLIPGVTFLIIFSYLPMFGLVMAFQDFTPLRSFKNSPWVGLKNFRDMLALPTFWNVVGNTLSISIAKIILRLLVPLILALLLNEVVHHKFMRIHLPLMVPAACLRPACGPCGRLHPAVWNWPKFRPKPAMPWQN